MNTTSKIAIGFGIGALLGATLGILFAPNKGSKTREMITDKSLEVKDSLPNKFENSKKFLGFNPKLKIPKVV